MQGGFVIVICLCSVNELVGFLADSSAAYSYPYTETFRSLSNSFAQPSWVVLGITSEFVRLVAAARLCGVTSATSLVICPSFCPNNSFEFYRS